MLLRKNNRLEIASQESSILQRIDASFLKFLVSLVQHMTKKYTKQEVWAALGRYRGHHDSLVHRMIPLVPAQMDTIVTFSQDYMIATQIQRVAGTGPVEAGNLTEKFYMCRELFEWAEGKKPEGKPLHEVLVDLMLEVEKDPYVAVSCDGAAARYVESQCQLDRQLERGKILKSSHTWFLLYEEQEVLGCVDLTPLELPETGRTVSILRQRKKL